MEGTSLRALCGAYKSSHFLRVLGKGSMFVVEEKDEKAHNGMPTVTLLDKRPLPEDPITFLEPSTDSMSDAEVDRVLAGTKSTIKALFRDYGSVGGSVGILRNGKHTFIEFGSQDPTTNEPVDRDTIYLISSMAKPFTALAVAMLVNDSKIDISLTSPVRNFLPELQGNDFLAHTGQPITIADLLDHQSDFLRCTNLWESPNGFIPWQDVAPLLSLFQTLPRNPKFRHPHNFRHARNYSNESYALLAEMVERLTGKPWTRFIRDRILRPLGLTSTVVSLTEPEHAERGQRGSSKIALSFAVPVSETLSRLSAAHGDAAAYDVVHPWVVNNLPQLTAQCVSPSQARHAAAGTLSSTPIGAAAGIMSSARDLLRFYELFMEVYNDAEKGRDRVQAATNGTGQPTDMDRIRQGMATLYGHIKDMMAADESRTYAAGWNTVNVPWDPKSATRWPGADGDNSRRIEKSTREMGQPSSAAAEAWHFLQQQHDPDTTAPTTQKETELALFHGGNMVGATSFCLLLPARQTAVVVLCNTRGFFVDAANLAGMLLSECLFRNLPSSPSDMAALCARAAATAAHLAASYVRDLQRYELALARDYHSLTVLDTGGDGEDYYAPCCGTFQLVPGVVARVAWTAADNGNCDTKTGGSHHQLTLALNGQAAWAYPLRLKTGCSPHHKSCTMTFAMPMGELVRAGVGGNNRLEARDFEVTFRNRTATAAGGLPTQFQGLVWVFDRSWLADPHSLEGVDLGAFTFRRLSPGSPAV
ncbi:beta-lactamase/transpeptidase-like protein [Lasiosphaeria miniovina]|uniref:Beta-lactamase/transpeptidase-like protein n=1 Tax=Lasiosphaeria miniovina TaxID=1954250 RepID=A0AA40DS84_9PEZI|nr:beta-lactamase/transpeptidase-like protein [Lasiosphaeria miniovina]KAK0710073.1 beta-lactamase/transpeptidase-like protein [Lasiosphaeria miniovina]